MTSRSLVLETKCEFLKLLRTPSYIAGTLLFPLMFYLLFGVAIARQKAAMSYMSRYLLATYGAGGVIGAVMFGLAVTLAVERAMGWLQLRHATPARPAIFLFAKAAVCLVFAAAVVATLFAAGILLADVRMPVSEWLSLAGVLIAGALPFTALALAIGYFASATAAPAIVNTIYMPMCFLSGLWIPIQMFPPTLQNIAAALPGNRPVVADRDVRIAARRDEVGQHAAQAEAHHAHAARDLGHVREALERGHAVGDALGEVELGRSCRASRAGPARRGPTPSCAGCARTRRARPRRSRGRPAARRRRGCTGRRRRSPGAAGCPGPQPASGSQTCRSKAPSPTVT